MVKWVPQDQPVLLVQAVQLVPPALQAQQALLVQLVLLALRAQQVLPVPSDLPAPRVLQEPPVPLVLLVLPARPECALALAVPKGK